MDEPTQDQRQKNDGLFKGLARSTGEPVVFVGRDIIGIYSVLVRTLYFSLRGRREEGSTLQEMYEIGNRSLLFITVVMGFIGMIFVYQGGVQAQRIIPDLTLLGATYLEYLIRALASDIGAMMLATRVGAGIAAEIGSMKVTEQIDALRMSGIEPIDYLLVPRFRASLLLTPALALYGGAIALAAGTAVAHYSFGVNPRIFVDFSTVTVGDGVVGLTKTFAFGAAIPIVSGAYGLATRGGSEGVGGATTRAVIGSSLAVLVLDFVIGALGFVIFPPAGVS
jgi:phospholipid/cholesterol/gamma-HCH transport system permease protein